MFYLWVLLGIILKSFFLIFGLLLKVCKPLFSKPFVTENYPCSIKFWDVFSYFIELKGSFSIIGH